MSDLKVTAHDVEITQRITVELAEPRETILVSWKNEEVVRVEVVRFRFGYSEGRWRFGWAEVYHRRIRKDGSSYERQQSVTVSLATMQNTLPDILEAAWPKTTITIEGNHSE